MHNVNFTWHSLFYPKAREAFSEFPILYLPPILISNLTTITDDDNCKTVSFRIPG